MQDHTAERQDAPPRGREHVPYSNGHDHASPQSEPEAEPRDETTRAQPGGGLTYVDTMMVGEIIVNHYHCDRKANRDIMESAPEAGQEEGPMEQGHESRRTFITPTHAEHLSEGYWRQHGRKGRTRQAIMEQLHRFEHIQSDDPPKGRASTLIVRESFERFDQTNPPREDRTGRQAQT